MKNTPLVSIIIPVYNGSNYLREAIESALAQSYNNVEVIVVNDGSEDRGATEDIALSYGKEIRYFTKPNGGVSSALNLGIRKMKGDWFAWLSHDDYFSKNRIESDMELIESKEEVRITFCKVEQVDMLGKNAGSKPTPFEIVSSPYQAIVNYIDMCSTTIHRSCLQAVGFFNEKNRTTQDVEILIRLASKYKLHFNPKAVSFRRHHKDMGTKTLKKQHKKDSLTLAGFVYREIGFERFFLKEGERDMDEACAWKWFGDFYSTLGAFKYADQCYEKAFKLECFKFLKILFKNALGSRIVHLPAVRKARVLVESACGKKPN